ncbi:MAG: UvrD-helicase domain-containing protein [Clostridiales bacterium]|nr:UvrD-helicase domain-containing protein [Clostridiales bacterium]
MKFSPQQQRVIDSRGKNLLVSAAAGSGKTTVLVERVLGLVRDGVDIENILIVTFTRASSHDMKTKLFNRLSEEAEAGDELMALQLEKLDLAQISTLHSFCSSAVKASFEIAGVDPNYRILEPAEEEILSEDALTQELEALLEQQTPGVDTLMLMRGPEQVRQMARELIAFLDTRSDPEGWIEYALRLFDGSGELWQETLMEACRTHLDSAEALLDAARAICLETDGPGHYLKCLEKDMLALEKASRLGTYEEMRVWAEDFQLTRPGKGGEFDQDKLDTVKALRDNAKTKHLKAIKELMDIPLSVALNDIHSDRDAMNALARLCLGTCSRLWELKQAKAAVSFNDLEHLTLKILDDPDTVSALRQRYKYIFIDEYQDTSDLQETIACRLSDSSNRFMVGDVKQSIYRFRNAEPELFLEAYGLYRQGGDNELVVLSQNFRSAKPVIELVNLLFERVMRGGDSEILYDADARLYQGLPDEGEDMACELMLLNQADEGEESEEDESDEKLDETELKTAELEALLIGKRIKEMKDADKTLSLRDFCVICRARQNVLTPMAETLSRIGVSAYADGTENSFLAIEVSVTLNVLKVLVNRHNEVALLSAARSPMFNITNSELAQARIRCPKGLIWDAFVSVRGEYPQIDRMLTLMEGWRAMAPALGVRALIRRILEDTGFYVFCGALEEGRRRQLNLDLLCKRAQDYENDGGYSISGFTRLMDLAGVSDGDGAHELGENDDVVRLMTAHKSKGLEFKVVFAAQLGRKYSAGARDGSIFADKKLGAGFIHMDERLGTARPTLATRAIKTLMKRKDRAEELRVLYVTLTRAQKKLILVGSVKDLEKSLTAWKMGAAHPEMYTSSLDIAASAAMGCPGAEALGAETDPGKPRVNVGVYSVSQALSVLSEKTANELGGLLDEAEDVAADKEILARLNWQYPFSQQSELPVKLSVTGLERELVGGSELPRLRTVPRFLSGEGEEIYTQRGTAMHRALRLFELEALRDQRSEAAMTDEVRRQLDSMLDKQLITPEERELCSEWKLSSFWQSDTGKRALASDEVRREWSFVIRLGLRDALGLDEEGTVLVQGTLDMCFVEDGKWVLVDYKTDRAGEEDEILTRYERQLKLYRRALEELTGREVKHTYICLVSQNKRIEVEK